VFAGCPACRSPAAIVTEDGLPVSGPVYDSPDLAYMGCLRADGRERLLEQIDSDGNYESVYYMTAGGG
jgi:hypothetical protein